MKVKIKSLLGSVAILALFSNYVHAQDNSNLSSAPFQIGIGASSLGATISTGYRFSDDWGIRAFGTWSEFTVDIEEQDTRFQALTTLSGLGLVGDYYPVGGQDFRLTGGAFIPKFTLRSDSQGTETEINGRTYAVSDLEATIRSKGVSPYLGLGYDWNEFGESGWGASVDLGAMFGLSYDKEYSYDPSSLPSSEITIFEQEVNDILNGVTQDVEDNFGTVPFISLDVHYRF